MPFKEFIEATAFTKYVYDYLSEDEYQGLQNYLLQYPEAGKGVHGSGGVRKFRWRIPGKGKSGGVRVIYYLNMLCCKDRINRDTLTDGYCRPIP